MHTFWDQHTKCDCSLWKVNECFKGKKTFVMIYGYVSLVFSLGSIVVKVIEIKHIVEILDLDRRG